jgi:hypothetical protein
MIFHLDLRTGEDVSFSWASEADLRDPVDGVPDGDLPAKEPQDIHAPPRSGQGSVQVREVRDYNKGYGDERTTDIVPGTQWYRVSGTGVVGVKVADINV